MKRLGGTVMSITLTIAALGGCGTATDGSGSEIATSAVSGALNNTGGSTVGWNEVPTREKKGVVAWMLDALDFDRPAWAATWTCTGGTMAPPFAGNGPAKDPYAFTPVSCTVMWGNGKMASSKWSGDFTLNYSAACDSVHPWIEHQKGGCSVTRTTAAGGNTRTITGPQGNAYAVTHDTNGAGTGWDTTVSPAPTNDGLSVACGSAGCESDKTLTIAGSHITATVIPAGGMSSVLWNHTVSTGAGGITVTGTGASRVVTGSVTVQHNLAKFTSTTVFTGVGFGDPLCCFPTSGSVKTTFESGPDKNKTESLAFSAVCGEATLTGPDGKSSPFTLSHCL